MANPTGGIQLEFADDRSTLTAVDEINRQLAPIGVGVWPLDFRDAPEDVLRALDEPTLTNEQAEAVKQHFLLSREQLLEVIGRVGRRPHVPGGGALSSYVVSHDYWYPQLYVAEEGVDYSRFDRFHVNAAEDGTGTDEVLQILSGGRVILHHPLTDGVEARMYLDCAEPGTGWICTYDGAKPHIGQLSESPASTKVLVQVIGAERWSICYVDEKE